MNRFITVLVLASVSFTVFAQDENRRSDDEIRTIFSKHRGNGGYGAFTLGYGHVEGKDAFISGVRGMFIFNHTLAVGFGGYGFVNDLDHHHYIDGQPDQGALAGGYGGLIFEPIIGPSLPVHLSFPILVGVGGVVRNEGGWWENSDYHDEDHDTYLVFEPSAELEFNLTKFLRAAAWANYRFTSDIELEQTDPDILRGFNMGITFKIGKF